MQNEVTQEQKGGSMKQLEDFNVIVEQMVAWGEMDALSHVNNAVYFRYFETARIEYFDRIDIFTMFDLKEVGPVLKETSCQYRRPVMFPDTLFVGAKVSTISKFEFEMTYKIVSKNNGYLTTQGSATIVLLDFKSMKKLELPEMLVNKMKNIDLIA